MSTVCNYCCKKADTSEILPALHEYYVPRGGILDWHSNNRKYSVVNKTIPKG